MSEVKERNCSASLEAANAELRARLEKLEQPKPKV